MISKILLLGNRGQLGQELDQLLANYNYEIIGINREQLDLTQTEQLRDTVTAIRPDLIINCAAYTAVDKAETETELADQINHIVPLILAEESQKINSFLIHLSTDYVFDGAKNVPYQETDLTNPIGHYGKSKLAGEQAIINHCQNYLILRTAWVYGVYGTGNFVKTMLKLGAQRSEIRVVMDQVGSPTWTKDLATTIMKLISQLPLEISGIYHYTNGGVTSWYDFAIAIFEEAAQLGFPLEIERVIPIITAEYPTPAKRPAYSVLSTRKISHILGEFPPHWRQSLRAMLRDFSLN
jgi:dTDP-4-dehydrorhamnose reductase